MKSKKQIIKSIKVVTVTILALLFFGFVEKQHNEKICKSIQIKINQWQNCYFIDEKDIRELMHLSTGTPIIGSSFKNLDLKKMENKIISHKFVHDAEVYRDIRGELFVNIVQNRPIARIIQSDGPDAYISSEGEVLPISDQYTARVLLISGTGANELIRSDLIDTEFGSNLFKLLEIIDTDPFWRAEIAQIEIDHKGELTFHLQVGKQTVAFGQPVEISKKLKKLDIFFEQILPQKGWNSYEMVSVKYRDQIICK